MSSPFASAQEFREVVDRLFRIMSEDPQMGPRLREADVPQRFEFDDLGLALSVRAGREGEPANLWWTWDEEIDWSPRVRVTMSSQTANRYFQGRANVSYEILRKRIKTTGDLRATLELGSIIKPLHERYRAMIESDYPHLAA
ncbi:MAG TPA: hypothetical protein VGY13_03890 [Solirubrobacteraceae bacterium]|jgi:hypothetical protein|nr:hypothetical protein [Solirubrobacteraceae bacterium]